MIFTSAGKKFIVAFESDTGPVGRGQKMGATLVSTPQGRKLRQRDPGSQSSEVQGGNQEYDKTMQDPNEDTEWNDILRQKGIIPEKPKEKEITEEDIVTMLEQTIEKKANGKAMDEMNLDELDELEDEEEEKILDQYRQQRIAEIRALQSKSKYGDVREISAQDYVQEVNKAGEGVWVILHLYKQGIPLCALINQHLAQLAAKFPTVKFIQSISTTCIPNYPDKNLPTIFIYLEGEMKSQIVGPMSFRGMKLTQDELEFMLGRSGAVDTTIKEDPKPKVRDVLFSSLKNDDKPSYGESVGDMGRTTSSPASGSPVLVERNGVQNLVQELESPMQMHLDPARGFLDRLPVVIRTPAFHKRQTEDAETSEVVHSDPGRGRQGQRGSDATTTGHMTGHSCSLGRSGSVGCLSLLLHLSVTLAEVKHLKPKDVRDSANIPSCQPHFIDTSRQFLKRESDPKPRSQATHLGVSQRVYLVNGIAWSTASFAVQVVALDKDGVIGLASNPDVTLAHEIQLNAFANVETGPIAGLGSVDIAEGAQTKAVATRRIDVPIHGD
eukprot:maker-scaffold10_size831480-snap-gene-6.9 protein:Tk01835 transcript:maker-scaffold10_size831480-snap-gene-6.9-mRNA-1 annotation:"viral iap-associated factor homolog"